MIRKQPLCHGRRKSGRKRHKTQIKEMMYVLSLILTRKLDNVTHPGGGKLTSTSQPIFRAWTTGRDGPDEECLPRIGSRTYRGNLRNIAPDVACLTETGRGVQRIPDRACAERRIPWPGTVCSLSSFIEADDSSLIMI